MEIDKIEARPSDELLTPNQAAIMLGLKPATLANLRCSGKGPPFFKVGEKYVRYDRGELAAWLRRKHCFNTTQARAAA